VILNGSLLAFLRWLAQQSKIRVNKIKTHEDQHSIWRPHVQITRLSQMHKVNVKLLDFVIENGGGPP
jgi:hypothetical protein